MVGDIAVGLLLPMSRRKRLPVRLACGSQVCQADLLVALLIVQRLFLVADLHVELALHRRHLGLLPLTVDVLVALLHDVARGTIPYVLLSTTDACCAFWARGRGTAARDPSRCRWPRTHRPGRRAAHGNDSARTR